MHEQVVAHIARYFSSILCCFWRANSGQDGLFRILKKLKITLDKMRQLSKKIKKRQEKVKWKLLKASS